MTSETVDELTVLKRVNAALCTLSPSQVAWAMAFLNKKFGGTEASVDKRADDDASFAAQVDEL